MGHVRGLEEGDIQDGRRLRKMAQKPDLASEPDKGQEEE